jgi:hypothetical protein
METAFDNTEPAPAEPAAPPPDPIQALLDEFEAGQAGAQPEAELPADPLNDRPDNPQDDLAAIMEGLSGDKARVTELETEIGSLRAAEFQRAEREAFDGFSKKLQAECGPNVDEHFARTNLLAMAAENPALEQAWRFRSVTAEQRRAADLEFQQLEVLYWKTQQAPDDPRKAEALAQLERRGHELGLMMNAQKILNNAWRDVVSRAEKVKPAIDEDATADRNMVAAAIRDSGANRPMPPSPAPNFGSMTDNELREYTRKNFGYV